MGGIKDYTYQNIIFVHDFVFIFLILVFFMIMGYFIIILYEYTIDQHTKYFRLFFKDMTVPMDLYIHFVWVELKYLVKLRDTKMMRWNRQIISKWNHVMWPIEKMAEELPAIRLYANHMIEVLNQVHNLKLEVIWTFIPIMIILELIFPSLSLIADDEVSSKASLHTVNVIGNQWYWTYELNVVMGVVKQVSNLVSGRQAYNDANDKFLRLLTTTSAVSIPVSLKTSFFITSNDVAHSWAIPGLGLKIDAIPGRINLKTIMASKLGLYSGMCSELCGIEHGFMPISLQVLTLNKWGYNLEYAGEKTLHYNDIKNIWYI